MLETKKPINLIDEVNEVWKNYILGFNIGFSFITVRIFHPSIHVRDLYLVLKQFTWDYV